jgi:hypothetical protein
MPKPAANPRAFRRDRIGVPFYRSHRFHFNRPPYCRLLPTHAGVLTGIKSSPLRITRCYVTGSASPNTPKTR